MATTVATFALNNMSPDDPLNVMLAPPPNESLIERDIRLRRDAEAKRVSDAIDHQIREEAARRKKGNELKVLLLGQSASGKSTLQKQFRLMYAPGSLELERSAWRPVVYINIIKSIRTIFEALEFEYDLNLNRMSSTNGGSTGGDLDTRPRFRPEESTDDITHLLVVVETDPLDPTPSGYISSSPRRSSDITPLQDGWSQQLMTNRLRLAPLLSMEETLFKKLGTEVKVAPGSTEFFVRTGWQGIHRRRDTATSRPSSSSAAAVGTPTGKKRFSVESSGSFSWSLTSAELQHEQQQKESLIQQVGSLLLICQDDVQSLWNHPAVQALITKRRLRLEESSTYFLANFHEVVVPDYLPSDDHLLRARLRTMGVVEHVFEVPQEGTGKIYRWHLYDVGGARGQRPRWVPYFEEATAIIFMAPISAFDQYLEEDRRTNRIDDSLQLFTLICSSPLLKKAHLVLFLNKTDVLKRKLEMGVKVKKYITSYGDRRNDYETVSGYFTAHFKQVHRKSNVDTKRELYVHLTNVVDTKATRKIILNVQDAIFRDHLKESSML